LGRFKKFLKWFLCEPDEPTCQHPEVVKSEYGGFFSFDSYQCTYCPKTWDEAVIFGNNQSEKDEFKRLRKSIEGGKIKVIVDNSGYTSDFINDEGEGLDIALNKMKEK